MPITITCKNCGKEFKIRPSRIKQGRRKYCSKECHYKHKKETGAHKGKKSWHWKGGPVKKTCENCGKEFYSYLCHKRIYCSKVCKIQGCSKKYVGKNNKLYSRLEKTCVYCGKIFERSKSDVKNYGGKYCSRKCHYEHEKETGAHRGKKNSRYNQLERICKYCGKKFNVPPARIEDSRGIFCSKQCSNTAQSEFEEYRGENSPCFSSIKRNCRFCGKEFFEKPSRLSHGRGKFCSKQCFTIFNRGKNNPLWKGGGFPYYGPDWLIQKRKALRRSEHVSELSKESNGKLHVHHIISMRNFINKYIDLCLKPYISNINYSSIGRLRYEQILEVFFEEANRLDNLIVLTHIEHGKYGEMPIGFFEEIKKLNHELR